MSYCHECGEKVAPDDVYCPYCGIVLQTPSGTSATPAEQQPERFEAPISEAPQTPESSPMTATTDDDDSLSFEATQIDMPPTPAPLSEPLTESTRAAEETEPENEEVVYKDVSLPLMPDEFSSGAHSVNSILKNNTSEQIPFKTEEVEDLQSQIQDSAAQNEAEQFSEPAIGENLNPTAIEEKDSAVESVSEAQPEEIVAAPSESEINQAEWQVPEMPEAGASPGFEATAQYTPEDFRQQDLIAEKISDSGSSDAQSIEETERDAEPTKAESQIKQPFTPLPQEDNDDASLAETLISAPLPPPPLSLESQAEVSKNVGENVSADESPVAGVFEQVETPSPPSSADVAGSDQPGSDQQDVQSENVEGRPFTSPNVSSVDTGGKKAKLKTLSEGTVLNGRYEIVRKIGGGGMGAVYLASDRNLGGVLRAVKEMVQSYIEDAQQEKAINDFKRESLLLTSLEHPAIPTIFDYFYDEKEGRFYLVMKYISGGDLAARLRSAPEGRIDESSVTEWAIQIADVLDYLHNRQPPIVYRDLKPSNIMIDGNSGKVMLIDFGIARWVNKEEKGVTAVGTMGYAPPELFSGNVEPRSDIYSLGSTMFHLLTGADPQNNPLLIFDFNKHPRPRQINPQLSDQIELILMRAVEYNADRRFTSGAEMREALSKHLENVKSGRLTFGLGEKAAVAVADNQPVFCGFCGQKIVASDMFCPFCGAKQPLGGTGAIAGSQKPAFVAAPTKLTAKLYVVNTSDLEAPVFNLEKDTNLVGRRDPMSNIFPEVDLSKFDPQTKISRRHARIWREGDTFMVEDLGSSNGTTLMMKTNENIRLLPQQPRSLAHGDKIKLGDTTLHFVLG